MMGIAGERPTTTDGKTLEPPRGHGLPVMSIGFLVDADQPMVWRGPMVTQALTQMLADTRWGVLDYLVVDMPPGTGDIQLTLTQRVPVSGAVIVTTPQEIALLDARKGLKMFRKVGVPVLGIVENMGLHRCPSCGYVSHVFDAGGGAALAGKYATPLLGQIPLDALIREQADSGRPTVVAEPSSANAALFHQIARHAAGRLAACALAGAARLPAIIVEGE
jgi:ATP-binding protein involved in chromosome partitioning